MPLPPDLVPSSTKLDLYFDLAEHVFLRASLLAFLGLALYRLLRREWRKR
jgi:hypothetical protein